MAKKYQPNRRDKLKEHFREHPYFKLCKTVFNEFQEIYPTMVMTPEQLFEDASRTLDRLLQDGDITTYRMAISQQNPAKVYGMTHIQNIANKTEQLATRTIQRPKLPCYSIQ